MQKHFRTIFWIAIVVIIIIILAKTNETKAPDVSLEPVEENQIVKIGLSAPLSGNQASWGEPLRYALEMAKEDLPENTKYYYEVIFEDDGFKPATTASIASKFANIDKVDAMITLGSATGNTANPIAENSKMLHFGIASDGAVANGKYNFIHWTPPSKQAEKFVNELEERGIEKVALFMMNHQGTIAVVEAVEKELEGTDIEIVSTQKFNSGEKDFKSLIQKARSEEPEIYFLMAFTPELEILAKQIKEAGIEKPLTSIEAFMLTDQRDLFEGEWFVDAGAPTAEFSERFKEKADRNPGPGSPNVYDVFNILVDIYENYPGENKPTTEQVVEELNKLKNYTGVLGTLNMNEEGIILSEASVKEIRDGEGVVID